MAVSSAGNRPVSSSSFRRSAHRAARGAWDRKELFRDRSSAAWRDSGRRSAWHLETDRRRYSKSTGPHPRCPTLPFSNEETRRILVATNQYEIEMPSRGVENARRIRGLVLLLRYSGRRIGDAVTLNVERLEGNRAFLYTQKTGVAVNTVLPYFVASALAATPRVTEKFFFWSGRGKLESIVRSWQTRLRRLFKLANIQDGHAHRFRDTFTVELLLAGVPIERVSVLLGHQSVRITEKHYAPWVRSRQEQLEADLANAWSHDPLVLLQTEVHQRYTERADTTTPLSPIRKSGARGGGRTHTTRKRQGILSPPRMPFRHPGFSGANLYYQKSYHNIDATGVLCLNLQFHVNRQRSDAFQRAVSE